MVNLEKKQSKRFIIFIENLPYALMILLGASIFVLGFAFSFTAWLSAGLYAIYGIIGIFWIIVFVCPYCHNFGSGCFSGHGQISSMFRPKKDERLFVAKFKKNIPVIIAIYLIPIIAGVIFLIFSFSYAILALIILFALNSYLVAPEISKKYACANCSVRDECPWMGENSAFSRKKPK
jgi:hypothetical protein